LEELASAGGKIPGTARPLIWLTIEETPEGLFAHWQYNDGLFAESTIRRLADHFQNLLFSIVASPNQSIGKLPLLSSHERLRILFEWNYTYADYPHDKCIHELFEKQASSVPDAIAVEFFGHDSIQPTFTNQRFTYRQLNNQANQLANYLREQGVGPDVLVGVCFRRSVDMIVALFAVLKAGGAYVPLDTAYPTERLQFMLKDSGISVLITEKQILKEISLECDLVVCLDSDAEAIASYSSENLVVNVKPDNLAYVIYTSGSTGTAKGTLIHHRGVVNYLSWCVKNYAVSSGSGAPVNSSIAFDATVTSVFAPLVVGKRILLLPEKDEIEALSAVLLSDNDFSLVKITPAHLDILQHLLQSDRLQNQVRAIVIGGEALNYRSIELWRKYARGTRLINEYGPTETVVGCCTYEVSGESPQTGDVPIGRPIANTQMYILDRYLQPVPIGVSGEIYIGGAGVARGYLNRPDLTQERFVMNPFDENANARLYKTGDLGRYLPNGEIVFLGRIDHQVKIRGYRIELAEIETALAKHPAVIQATVIARDEHPEKKLVAYLVTGDSSVTSNHLRSHLANILPQYMLPASFVFLDKLPLTPNGKVDRKALPIPDHQNTRSENSYVAPRSKIETQLVAIFQKALNIEKIGVTDDFLKWAVVQSGLRKSFRKSPGLQGNNCRYRR
jgi:amino acid adenylation domain-containing protein